MQETSLQAYEAIQSKIGLRQAQVLKVIERSPSGITNSEIAKLLEWSINRVTPRTNELVKKGLVCEYEKRECAVTKNRAISWKYVNKKLF